MLHTILGVACFDPYFRRALFNNSAAAVRAYNSYVGTSDLKVLKAISEEKSLQTAFEVVAKQICTHPPCPPVPSLVLDVIGAALLEKSFLEKLFEDPIACANEHGFVLRYPEAYVLTSLICGTNGTGLKQAMVALGTRIIRLTEKVAMLTAA